MEPEGSLVYSVHKARESVQTNLPVPNIRRVIYWVLMRLM
jgi:hypothetical protein